MKKSKAKKIVHHIRKRFRNELTPQEICSLHSNPSTKTYAKDSIELKATVNNLMDREVIVGTSGGYFYKAFPKKISGNVYLFPEPDPTLVFFSSAQKYRLQIEPSKNNLLQNINPGANKITESITEQFYTYYEAVSCTVIFLFLSVESFINHLIPKGFEYKRENSNKTEIFTANQTQKHISFSEKLKSVIPAATGIDYSKKFPLKSKSIMALKDFRDNIVHTKSMETPGLSDALVTKSFSFNYDEVISTVFHFMNTYKTDYLVECDCGEDF